MKITPLEIRQKTFEKKTFGGIDKDDVQAYLTSLSQAWEKNIEENRELRVRLESAEREALKLREVESSLFRTLKTAEDTGNKIVEQANKTAELGLREANIKADKLLKEAKWHAKSIIEEAENEARKIYKNLQQQVKELEHECNNIQNFRENLLADIRNLANDLMDRAERVAAKGNNMNINFSVPRTPEFTPELAALKKEINDADKTKVDVSKIAANKATALPEKAKATSNDDSSSFFDQL